jgi:hypothetical protein
MAPVRLPNEIRLDRRYTSGFNARMASDESFWRQARSLFEARGLTIVKEWEEGVHRGCEELQGLVKLIRSPRSAFDAPACRFDPVALAGNVPKQ